MKSFTRLAMAAAALLACSAGLAQAQDQVGQATLIRTSVTGQTGELAALSPVYRDERIATSTNGLGEFRFSDGTKFAVGGGSSVVIDRFIYDSSKTFDKLTLNAARGSFRWISGKSKSEAYEIVTPAGTIGIRGTRLDIWVGPDATAVVLLSGQARFCGANGCKDLRRRCDVVVATPGGGVSDATRVNQDIFQAVGSDRAFPFLTGQQRLSSGFNSVFGGSCGLSSASNIGPKERGGGTERAPSRGNRGNDDGGGGSGSGSGSD